MNKERKNYNFAYELDNNRKSFVLYERDGERLIVPLQLDKDYDHFTFSKNKNLLFPVVQLDLEGIAQVSSTNLQGIIQMAVLRFAKDYENVIIPFNFIAKELGESRKEQGGYKGTYSNKKVRIEERLNTAEQV